MKSLKVLIVSLLIPLNLILADSEQSRLYDCAANSLYIFCQLNNKKISYSRSVELLPLTKTGNSMLELNNALKICGFKTQAKMIKPEDIVKIKYPSMVLNNTKENNDGLGHFFIMCPDNNGFITIYDYPKETQTYPANLLVALRR